MIYPLLASHNNQENLPPVVNNYHLPSMPHTEKDLNLNTANQSNKVQHPTSAAPTILAPRHNFVNKRTFGRDISNLPLNNP
jgi:hypothetical protein